MQNSLILKKADDFQTSQWAGGSTTQLYIYPEHAQYQEGNFQCRISSASVEIENSKFTSLPGVKRYLSIFDGMLKMVHGEGESVLLYPYEVDCFDGGVPTVSYGKVRDFNLMLKNGADGRMETLQFKPGESIRFCPEEGENLLVVYVAEGSIQIQDILAHERELILCRSWQSALETVNPGEGMAGIGVCRVKLL